MKPSYEVLEAALKKIAGFSGAAEQARDIAREALKPTPEYKVVELGILAFGYGMKFAVVRASGENVALFASRFNADSYCDDRNLLAQAMKCGSGRIFTIEAGPA